MQERAQPKSSLFRWVQWWGGKLFTYCPHCVRYHTYLSYFLIYNPSSLGFVACVHAAYLNTYK